MKKLNFLLLTLVFSTFVGGCAVHFAKDGQIETAPERKKMGKYYD